MVSEVIIGGGILLDLLSLSEQRVPAWILYKLLINNIKFFSFLSLLHKFHRSGNPAVLASADESPFINIAEKTSLYVLNDSNFNRKNKEPLELLEKIGSRYEKFLKEFLSDKPNFTKSVKKQLSSLWKRMGGMYTKLNPKCNFYEISDSNDTNERWNSY